MMGMLWLGWWIISCSPFSKDSSEKELQRDTLTVKGRTVVFFAPAEVEYKYLPNDQLELLKDMAAEFKYFSNIVYNKLQGTGILVFETNAHFISVESGKGDVVIDRKSLGKTLGVIYASPEKKPVIIGDRHSGNEYIENLVPYFTAENNN